MMDLGDRAAWEFCLVQIIQDRRDGSIRFSAKVGGSSVAIAVLLRNRWSFTGNGEKPRFKISLKSLSALNGLKNIFGGEK
jgi:hypothetical protein